MWGGRRTKTNCGGGAENRLLSDLSFVVYADRCVRYLLSPASCPPPCPVPRRPRGLVSYRSCTDTGRHGRHKPSPFPCSVSPPLPRRTTRTLTCGDRGFLRVADTSPHGPSPKVWQVRPHPSLTCHRFPSSGTDLVDSVDVFPRPCGCKPTTGVSVEDLRPTGKQIWCPAQIPCLVPLGPVPLQDSSLPRVPRHPCRIR